MLHATSTWQRITTVCAVQDTCTACMRACRPSQRRGSWGPRPGARLGRQGAVVEDALDGDHLLLGLRPGRERAVEQARDRQRVAQAQAHQAGARAPAQARSSIVAADQEPA